MKHSSPLTRVVPNPAVSRVRIEPAYDCDGSACHQPIFNEDGGLNHIEPHFHLVEWESETKRCYAITDVPLYEVAR
ncbi:MAG: hypothetical protein JWO91_3381 [Acidobacteriaceae bacterium]|jgi:hypothetical protein|nr:hypothetical protein [Acidobacteriaceae bacterium]